MEPSAPKLPQLLAQMRHRMTDTDHNVASIAKASGLPRRTVADLMGTRIPMSVAHLETLAKALGCRLTLTVVDDAEESTSAHA